MLPWGLDIDIYIYIYTYKYADTDHLNIIQIHTWAMALGQWHGAVVMRQWGQEATAQGSGHGSVGIGKWVWTCRGYLCFYTYMHVHKQIQAIFGWGCGCVLSSLGFGDIQLHIECMDMWTCLHVCLVYGNHHR